MTYHYNLTTYCKTLIHHPYSSPLCFQLLFKKMDDPYHEPTPLPTVETKGDTGCDCSPFTVSPLPATILFKQNRETVDDSTH